MIWSRRSIVSFVATSNKDDSVAFGRGRCLYRLRFSKKSDARQTMSLTDFPFFTYTLDDHSRNSSMSNPATLYVPLTSYCNTRTLPETRGPNFRLPPDVAATICRVRDLECDTSLWSFWCKWLDTCESYQQLPMPSEFSKVASLDEIPFEEKDKFSTAEEMIMNNEPMLNPQTDKVHRPTVEELVREIEWRLKQSPSSSHHDMTTIVVAGEGEPTLRLHALIQFINDLRKLNPVWPIQLRILTNGLLSKKSTHQLLNVCCQNSDLPIEFSVALMTHDSKQYSELMEPLTPSSSDSEIEEAELSPHKTVQNFIRAVVAQQAQSEGAPRIEVTAVDRPDVNTTLTNQLAASLGVSKPIRWRRYYE